MPTLISPGVSVTITNDSYYIPVAAATVPLIFLATRADKKQADGITPATLVSEHSIVRTMTSLNQAISSYGVPYFWTDNTGAPQHGDCRNEYGLMALNQALTQLSFVYVVRSNIDLADATKNALQPSSPVFVGTGNGSLSTPVINQGVADSELWTIITNPIAPILTVGTLVGGVNYTNGSYNVQLTGGTGSGATANLTISSGVVSVATLTSPGINYTVGDVLSVYPAYIGDGIILSGLGAIIPGSGYTSGSYIAVPLTGGSGTGAHADITVTAGAVTALANIFPGIGYNVGDVLSAPPANIGVSGSGFSVNVVSVSVSGGFSITVATINRSFSVSGFISGSKGNAYLNTLYNNGIVSFTISNGTVPFSAGDAWTFNVVNIPTSNPLGANDAAKRVTIIESLIGEINSNMDVRSDIYEYNIVLCPGYYETAASLLNLNDAIKDEAFVISDCPFDKTPEDTANWALTIARQSSNNISYYYPNAMTSNIDGMPVFCASSGVALKTIAYSDNVAEVWFAPAGFRRGVVTGITDIGYVIGMLGTATTFKSTPLNQGQRDILYQYPANINPISFFPGQGIVVFGQKTSVGNLASALDRINVDRLMLKMKRDIRKASMSYLFEMNDRITRDSIKLMIDNYLNDILLRRGLYDFVVVCDLTNNTPTRIDRNELWVDIAVQPEKAIEFIYIPINVVSTGAKMA